MEPAVKKRIKQVLIVTALNILFFMVTVYLLMQYFGRGRNIVQTEKTDIITRQEIFDGTGYVLRNESVILLPNSNNFIKYEISNGNKVGKDQTIALLYNNASDLTVNEQISGLEKQINILNRSNINKEYINTDIDKVEADIHEYYIDMLTDLKSGKVDYAGKSRDDMLILMNKRQIITFKFDNFNDIIAQYEERKNSLINSVIGGGNFSTNITAPYAGVFYHNVDGYENLFNKELIDNLSLEKFSEAVNGQPDNEQIVKGLGKLVKDYKWYIVCKLPKNKTFDFVQDKSYDLVFPNSSNKTLKFKLVKKLDDFENNEILLMFETMENPLNFNYIRQQTVKIVYDNITGLKVPENAMRILTDENGVTRRGVYVLKGNVVKFKELYEEDYLGMYDNYYLYKYDPTRIVSVAATAQSDETGEEAIIAQPLKLYDMIITRGKDLYEGKVID